MIKDKMLGAQAMNPLGSCQIELIFDSEACVIDFRLKEMNTIFATYLDWKQEMVGEKLSTLFKEFPHEEKIWLSLCNHAIQYKKTRELTYSMASAKCCLTLSAMPLGQNQMVLFLRPADEQLARQKEAEARMEVLRVVEPLFESKNYAVALLEFKEGVYRYVKNNDLYTQLTGLDDLAEKSISVVFKSALRQKIEHYLDEAIQTNRLVQYERSYEVNEREFTLYTELTPIVSTYGIPYILSYSKDVSEVNKFKKENRQLSKRLRAMFDQQAAIKIIFDVETEKILSVNPSACEFYGYTEEEFLNLHLSDINQLCLEELYKEHNNKGHGNTLLSSIPQILKNGEVRLLDVYCSTIWDGSERVTYAIAYDVTDREMLRQKLIHEEELLRITLQLIGDGVIAMDKQGNITSFNDEAEKITGWQSHEVLGQSFADIFTIYDEKTREKIDLSDHAIVYKESRVTLENTALLLTKEKRWLPIAKSEASIKDQHGQYQGVVIVFRDIQKEMEQLQQIKFLSYHDPITKLYNRHYVEKHFSCFSQPSNFPITVIMADVNGLKLTNDVFGHKAGDELLKEIAEVFNEVFTEQHIISRWGGDEFVVILPKTQLQEAEEMVEKIHQTTINVPSIVGVNASVSLGFATITDTKKTIMEAMNEAEEYMYHQKLLDGKSYRHAIINSLLATLYEKSNETEEHSHRLVHYCQAIGKKMKLTSNELNELDLLCLLHDIGKVGVDPNVLNKPGRLTDSEWREMKRHAEIGYRIAQATPELAPFAHLILSHHERWDGNGYPHKLSKCDIPLACRILAVADSYDAMTNDRVYRKALSKEAALEEIRVNARTQFDPKVVDIFLSILTDEEQERDNK